MFHSVCFPCFFFSDCVPRSIWFGSTYLVTTAGFVADPLMWNKQQHQLLAVTLLVCLPVDRKASVRYIFSVEFCLFNSHGHSGGEGNEVPVSLYSQRRRFWKCMPAGREGERAGY